MNGGNPSSDLNDAPTNGMTNIMDLDAITLVNTVKWFASFITHVACHLPINLDMSCTSGNTDNSSPVGFKTRLRSNNGLTTKIGKLTEIIRIELKKN